MMSGLFCLRVRVIVNVAFFIDFQTFAGTSKIFHLISKENFLNLLIEFQSAVPRIFFEKNQYLQRKLHKKASARKQMQIIY